MAFYVLHDTFISPRAEYEVLKKRTNYRIKNKNEKRQLNLEYENKDIITKTVKSEIHSKNGSFENEETKLECDEANEIDEDDNMKNNQNIIKNIDQGVTETKSILSETEATDDDYNSTMSTDARIGQFVNDQCVEEEKTFSRENQSSKTLYQFIKEVDGEKTYEKVIDSTINLGERSNKCKKHLNSLETGLDDNKKIDNTFKELSKCSAQEGIRNKRKETKVMKKEEFTKLINFNKKGFKADENNNSITHLKENGDTEQKETKQKESEQIETEQIGKEQIGKEQIGKEQIEKEQTETELIEKQQIERNQKEAKQIEVDQKEEQQIEAGQFETRQIKMETEEMVMEQMGTEQIQPEQIDNKQIETEQIEGEQIGAKQIEREQIDTKQIETDEMETDQMEADQMDSEQPEAEQIEVEQKEKPQIHTGQIETDQIEKEKMETVQMETEPIEEEQINNKQLETELVYIIKQIEREQIDAEQIKAKQIEIEQIDNEQLETKQINQEKIKTEKIDTEQIETEQVEPNCEKETNGNDWGKKIEKRKIRKIKMNKANTEANRNIGQINALSNNTVMDDLSTDIDDKFVKILKQQEKASWKRENIIFISQSDKKEKVINREYELYKTLIIPHQTQAIKYEKEFAAKLNGNEKNKNNNNDVAIHKKTQIPEIEKKDVNITKNLKLNGTDLKPPSAEERQLYWIFFALSWLPVLLILSLVVSFLHMLLEMEKI